MAEKKQSECFYVLFALHALVASPKCIYRGVVTRAPSCITARDALVRGQLHLACTPKVEVAVGAAVLCQFRATKNAAGATPSVPRHKAANKQPKIPRLSLLPRSQLLDLICIFNLFFSPEIRIRPHTSTPCSRGPADHDHADGRLEHCRCCQQIGLIRVNKADDNRRLRTT